MPKCEKLKPCVLISFLTKLPKKEPLSFLAQEVPLISFQVQIVNALQSPRNYISFGLQWRRLDDVAMLNRLSASDPPFMEQKTHQNCDKISWACVLLLDFATRLRGHSKTNIASIPFWLGGSAEVARASLWGSMILQTSKALRRDSSFQEAKRNHPHYSLASANL